MSRKHHHHHDCPRDRDEILERLLRACYDFKDCKCKPGARFSKEEACEVARVLGVNTASPCFDLDEFWMGLNVELEHGTVNPATNITNNDPITTGKIALAHLNQYPDYYTRLARMRKEAREDWSRFRRHFFRD